MRLPIISSLALMLLITGGRARADKVLLRSGEEVVAHLEWSDAEETYCLILEDGSERRVAVEDVVTILEESSLPLLDSLENLERRVSQGQDDEVFDKITDFRTQYPKSGERVRGRLAAMLRALGARRLEGGNTDKAWEAYYAALQILPGDKKALLKIEELRPQAGRAHNLTARSYFPIQEGARWVYQLDGVDRLVRIISVKAELKGVIEAVVEEGPEMPGPANRKKYRIVLDSDGLWRIDSRRKRLLGEPIQVGTRWTEQEPLVLRTWEYVAIGERVKLGDKTYSDCLKVKITTTAVPLPVDPVIVYRYYARGVGLIKTEWDLGTMEELIDYRIEK
ncbi:MAG: hypothetical protein O7H41_08855 [Planctomycetota bacterium]|nr:hypothetical protein [Planctomycetota bacterium]